MKNHIKVLLITIATLLQVSLSFAGLDWNYGALSGPDNVERKATATAYATNGTIFVAGTEKSTTGDVLIVTKKFSSAGILLTSVTNSYFSANGTVSNDYVKSVTVDANGNVYVLGSQFGGTNSRGQDVVVIKYNSSLVQQWKKLIYSPYLPPNGYNDVPCKLLINGAGDVFVSGTWATDLPGFTEEIFVQKYTSSGTLVYTQEIPQLPGLAITKATDMCLDNNSNATVCAGTTDNKTILHARINSTGGIGWRKFYYAPSMYTYKGSPEIECTSNGGLYLGCSLDRITSQNSHYARHMVVSVNTSGNLIWETLSTDLNQTAGGVTLRTDATGYIYSGSDFTSATGPMSSNHRIYKFNSSGILQWNYVSLETSQSFTFETFGSTSIFILFQKSSPVNPMLRKLNTSAGTIIWSEDMPFGGVPGYYHSQLKQGAIAINSSTSEVSFCGTFQANVLAPSYAEEYRWNVRKYGATTPRLALEEKSVYFSELKRGFMLLPNPAKEIAEIYISSDSEWVNFSTVKIRLTNLSGKELLTTLLSPVNQTLSILAIPDGIYLVHLESGQRTETQKLVIRH